MNELKEYSASDISIIKGKKGFIGKGGFGTVRLCKNEVLDWIAIKKCCLYGTNEQISKAEKM